MNTVPNPTYVQQTTVYHQPELTYEQRVHMKYEWVFVIQ
jgi:hypothetical protein